MRLPRLLLLVNRLSDCSHLVAIFFYKRHAAALSIAFIRGFSSSSSPLNSIKMEAPTSTISIRENEEKELKGLLEAFACVFSLEEIASAYCEAGRNAVLAGQILCDMQGSTSASSPSVSNAEAKVELSTKPSDYNLDQKSLHMKGQVKAVKQKLRAVSAGSVSSVIGKEYVKSMPAANFSCEVSKPLKLDSKEFPVSELWGEESNSSWSRNDRMHKDMEDFLFKMLGDGFQLERDVIRHVLDKCGYDMQKSMEKLLDTSASNLDKRTKFVGKSTEKAFPDSGGPSCKWEPLNSRTGESKTNKGESTGPEMERRNLQKEVLASLFNAGDRSEDLPRRTAKATRRSLLYGEPVVEPPKDFISEQRTRTVELKKDNDNGEEKEDDYQRLRRAVKEYRVTMKEYYKVAVDAFAKGEYDRANKLMDEGKFFHEKAREADEESLHKNFETTNIETRDEMLLDVHESGAKEAILLLKCHLSTLSGISCAFRCLKVIIETDEEDTSKGARRRLVMKLLDKESIKWTQGDHAGTILIPLEDINPKRLSFAKKIGQ